jgi:hypothetical protein
MAKKKPKNTDSMVLRKFQKHKQSYEMNLMDLDLREIHTKFWFKYISKGIAILITAGFSFIAFLNYVKNIPIPTEIKIAIPFSASFITDVGDYLIKFLRKPPP